MPNIPSNVAAVMRAAGGMSPVNMLELQTIAGQRYFWADARISALTYLSRFDGGGQTAAQYEPLLLAPPQVKLTGTLATPTTQATIGNLRGDTITRNLSKQFSKQQIWGALVYYRLYLPSCEYTLIDFLGNVGEPEIDEEQMDLPLTGFCNWGAIKAPLIKIDMSCSLTFGSAQCGSTSATPCQNTYGTCSSLERQTGCQTLWNTSVTSPPLVQISQPPPPNIYNPRRAG